MDLLLDLVSDSLEDEDTLKTEIQEKKDKLLDRCGNCKIKERHIELVKFLKHLYEELYKD